MAEDSPALLDQGQVKFHYRCGLVDGFWWGFVVGALVSPTVFVIVGLLK